MALYPLEVIITKVKAPLINVHMRCAKVYSFDSHKLVKVNTVVA